MKNQYKNFDFNTTKRKRRRLPLYFQKLKQDTLDFYEEFLSRKDEEVELNYWRRVLTILLIILNSIFIIVGMFISDSVSIEVEYPVVFYVFSYLFLSFLIFSIIKYIGKNYLFISLQLYPLIIFILKVGYEESFYDSIYTSLALLFTISFPIALVKYIYLNRMEIIHKILYLIGLVSSLIWCVIIVLLIIQIISFFGPSISLEELKYSDNWDSKLYRFSEKSYLVEIKKFYKTFGLLTYIITFKISTLTYNYLKKNNLW